MKALKAETATVTNNTLYFENTDQISVIEAINDDCLLDFNGRRVMLSYEAAYDLALRLAYFIQHADENASDSSSTEGMKAFADLLN